MKIEHLWTMVNFLNDYTVTAIDASQEFGLEVYILKDFKDAFKGAYRDSDSLFGSQLVGITDLESGDTTEVTLKEFISNIKDEVLKEDYDAVDAINFFQIGVFGEIVYG